MEVAPVGEMYTHVSITGRYDESLAKNLYSQLISAVEFMVKFVFFSWTFRNKITSGLPFFWSVVLRDLVIYLSLYGECSMRTTYTIVTSRRRMYSCRPPIVYGLEILDFRQGS